MVVQLVELIGVPFRGRSEGPLTLDISLNPITSDCGRGRESISSALLHYKSCFHSHWAPLFISNLLSYFTPHPVLFAAAKTVNCGSLHWSHLQSLFYQLLRKADTGHSVSVEL